MTNSPLPFINITVLLYSFDKIHAALGSKILSKTYLGEIRLIIVWWMLNKPKYTKLSKMTSCSDNLLTRQFWKSAVVCMVRKFIDHRSLRIQNVHHPSTKVENTWEKLRFISLANILWLFVPWFIAPCSAGKIMSSITCSSMQAVLKINQSFPIHTHTQRSCMRSQATGPCDVMLKRKTTGFQLCWHLPRGKHTHRYLNKTVEIDREI